MTVGKVELAGRLPSPAVGAAAVRGCPGGDRRIDSWPGGWTPPLGGGRRSLGICSQCPWLAAPGAGGTAPPQAIRSRCCHSQCPCSFHGGRRKRLERLCAEVVEWSSPGKRANSAESVRGRWGRAHAQPQGPEPPAQQTPVHSPGFQPPLHPKAGRRVAVSEARSSSERCPRTRVPAWPPGPPASVDRTQLPW